MTKGDCALMMTGRFFSPIYNGMVERVRRVVCENERVYTPMDWAMLPKGQRLEPPPCTCPPMLEPWEMI